MKAIVAILGAIVLVGVAVAPAGAVPQPFFCGPSNVVGFVVTCTGTVDVNTATNIVTLTFSTFDAPGTGGLIDTLGIQLPDPSTFNAATTINAGYGTGAGNLSFDAEINCDPACAGGKGEGSTPFSMIFGYNDPDFTPQAVTAPANRTGSCDGFNGTGGPLLWGCMHVFRTGDVNGNTSAFVPLQVTGQVPEPGVLILLGTGLVGLAVAARKKIGR